MVAGVEMVSGGGRESYQRLPEIDVAPTETRSQLSPTASIPLHDDDVDTSCMRLPTSTHGGRGRLEEEENFLLSLDGLSISGGVPGGAVTWSWKQFFSFCGSGLLMAVAFLDPGNLEADIQVGVTAGYSLLWWFAICSVLLGVVVQCLAGRLGLVTGQDLAQQLGQRYPRGSCIMLWIFLEIGIVSADIQETIGSAIALSILTGGSIPLWAGCILISITAFALLMLDSCGFRQLEVVFAAFIAIMAVSLGINFFQAQIPPKELAYGLVVPQLSRRTIPVAVAALGALVMPYNVFFQSNVVIARPRDGNTDAKKSMLIRYMELENFIVLTMAFIVNVFVVCVFAKGFYGPDPPKVGLESAGDHLAEEYGDHFRTLWAIGLLASGQVSTIGLTYAGQLVMTGLLNIKVQAGLRMVATRSIALIPTVILAIVFDASNTFDYVTQILNVVQSLLVPFALIPVIHMTASEEVMGPRFKNPAWLTRLASVIGLCVTVVNVYLMFDIIHREPPRERPLMYAAATIFIILYLLTILYVAVGPDNIPAARAAVREWGIGMKRGVNRCLGTKFGGRQSLGKWDDVDSMLEVQ